MCEFEDGQLSEKEERYLNQLLDGTRQRDARIRHAIRGILNRENASAGDIFFLAHEMWKEDAKGDWVAADNVKSIGPAESSLVICPHLSPVEEERAMFLDSNGHCDWCRGSGRVTNRVRRAMRKELRQAMEWDGDE